MVKPDCARPNTPTSNPKDLGELDDQLLDRIWTMIQYAPSKGLVCVSGYRDPGRQWDLRRGRCPGRECNRACKGNPTTAVPYASNHGKRKAVDLGGRDLDWAWRNAHRFGLHTPVRGEKWHFEVAGRCQVPIIRYPGRRWHHPATPPMPADPNRGRLFCTFTYKPTNRDRYVTDKALYARGCRNDQIVGLEILLQALGYYKGAWDGVYGPVLLAAWRKAKLDLRKIDSNPMWRDTSSTVARAQYLRLEGLVNLFTAGKAPKSKWALAA